MKDGKKTCMILKEIRRQIAEANDIRYVTSECRYKGDCEGTCPRCEAEVRYLEDQLRERRMAGRALSLAGISAGTLAMLASAPAQARMPEVAPETVVESVATARESFRVGGTVLGLPISENGAIEPIDTLQSAVVMNLRTDVGVLTDENGRFEIEAAKGDTIQINALCYWTQRVTVEEPTDNLRIIMDMDDAMFESVVVGGVYLPQFKGGILDLIIVDEKGERVDPDLVDVYRVYKDEDGDDDEDWLDLEENEEEKSLRMQWNYNYDLTDRETGEPFKKVKLRIEVDGYDKPVFVDVKYPKKNGKKTIKLRK